MLTPPQNTRTIPRMIAFGVTFGTLSRVSVNRYAVAGIVTLYTTSLS